MTFTFIYDEGSDAAHLVRTKHDEFTLCGVRWAGDQTTERPEEHCADCMNIADA